MIWKKKIKIEKIFELKFKNISKKGLTEFKKFCVYKDVNILDSYNDYFLIGIENNLEKKKLIENIKKLKFTFEEISFREPNLDEIFLEK